MSNPIRVKMVHLLEQVDVLCTCEFEGLLGLSQSKVSYHLKALEAGIVDRQTRGQWRYYGLAHPGILADLGQRRKLKPKERCSVPKIEIFEPAMCCSTGVCGANVDPALVHFASDFEWLQNQGVDALRINLSQEPQAFFDNWLVRDLLHQVGTRCLPLVLVDGKIAFQSAYPTRSELAAAVGLNT
ncbi:MAG: arsenite efflux transporter metallochaperone ArsD [Symbiobacteriia bacterium]